MKKKKTSSSAKDKQTTVHKVAQLGFLGLFLAVMALRVTFTESPGGTAGPGRLNVFSSVYSLGFTMVLLAGVCGWIVLMAAFGHYRRPIRYLEIPIALLIAAGLLATLAASDTRAAVTHFTVLAGGLAAGAVLVHSLDSAGKIAAVLVVVAGLGVMTTYQYLDQHAVGAQETVSRYEADPEEFLRALEVNPGSFQHLLLQHRLYSPNIKSFFTTANSAGSFSILASFAALALVVGRSGEKKTSGRAGVLGMMGFAICAVGVFLTQSKGAIAAFLIGLAVFGLWWFLRVQLARHKRLILAVAAAAVVLGGIFVAAYGQKHGTLPGGKSMLIRWQYWQATGRMIADNPVFGVGGGNFKYHYTAYKLPEAVETVSDPHNMPLAVLSQYGPLALAAMLAIVIIPPAAAVQAKHTRARQKLCRRSQRLVYVLCPVIAVVLLVVRPFILPLESAAAQDGAVLLYAVAVLYIAPALVFFLGSLLMSLPGPADPSQAPDKVSAALFAGLIGFLIHNLVDFAIFEPAVYMTFLALWACLLALNTAPAENLAKNVGRGRRWVAPTAAVAVLPVIFVVAFVGPFRSALAMNKFYDHYSRGHLDRAMQLSRRAMELDRLDPAAANMAGRVRLGYYHISKDTDLLYEAQDMLLEAVDRNLADFRLYENLADVYMNLGRGRGQSARYYRLALEAQRKAVQRYPGSERLHFKLARIAEKLDEPALAVGHYRKAVEIEQDFREFFPEIFPGTDFVSRLGAENYRKAKQKIESLSQATEGR